MVKKALLGIVVVVLLLTVGTGALVSTQFGAAPADTADGSQSDGADGSEPASTATPTPSDGDSDTPTPTSEQTATPDKSDQQSIPARNFNEQNVSQYIRKFLNEEREAAGVPTFQSGMKTEEDLNTMAKGHSEAMAVEGKAIHKIDSVSSEERYKNSGLYERCKFTSAEGSYIETPDDARFEAVGKTVAGETYEEDGTERFNGNDREIAKAIVSDWMDWPPYKERLLLENADLVGIGVEITDTGNVYATANICG